MKKFIVLEGTDGSGKKTQAGLLKQYFEKNGQSVFSTSFPNYNSPSSGPVKMYLGGQLCSNANELNAYQSSILYAADRVCTMKQLENKDADIWLFDRYVESSMTHQGGKIEDERELNRFIKWLEQLEYGYLKLPKPDMVIFLNMPPKASIALARARGELKAGTSKDIHEIDSGHLTNAYNAGIKIAAMQGWKVVDCEDNKGRIKSIEEIHKEIVNVINREM